MRDGGVFPRRNVRLTIRRARPTLSGFGQCVWWVMESGAMLRKGIRMRGEILVLEFMS